MLPERQYIDEISLYPEEQPKVHLEVYTNDKKKTKHRHLRKLSPKQKLIVCLIVIFSMSLFYVALEAKITQVGYSVNQLQSDIAEAQKENDRLMLEVEELSSPERIAQYAGVNDGMKVVDESSILYADIEIADNQNTADGSENITDSGNSNNAADSNISTENQSAATVNADQSVSKENSNNGLIGAFSTFMAKLSGAKQEAAELAK
jgi:cell division protein FtsL